MLILTDTNSYAIANWIRIKIRPCQCSAKGRPRLRVVSSKLGLVLDLLQQQWPATYPVELRELCLSRILHSVVLSPRSVESLMWLALPRIRTFSQLRMH